MRRAPRCVRSARRRRRTSGASSASSRSCRTATRSAIRSASARLCVDRRIAQPSARRPSEQRANAAGDLRVEPGGRLVQQQDVGVVQQRARQRHLLAHAFRQLGGAQLDDAVSGPACRAARPPGPPPRSSPYSSLYIDRFSRTVRRSQRPGASVRKPIRRRRRRSGRRGHRHAVDRDCAAVGPMSPASILNVVVFPAPFGPSSATISPRATVNVTRSTTTLAPNCRVSPAAAIIADRTRRGRA